MKKGLCILLAVLLLAGLSGCSFTSNFNDSVGLTTMEATEQVQAMMDALAEGDMEAAEALLHPVVTQAQKESLAQLQKFLAGRKAVKLEQVNLKVHTANNASGKTRQEQAAFRVELSDAASCYLTVSYVTNPQGEGFNSFQIVLGIV